MTTFTAPSGGPRSTPLLLIHGGSHTGACFEVTPDGRPGWAPYFAQAGRTAHVVDWPGHGRSSGPDPFHTMSMQYVADAVTELLADLGPVVLVTHSMGAVVGWRVAEQARDNVEAIVAIAPGPPANLQPPLDAAEIARVRDEEPERWIALGRPSPMPESEPVPVVHETALRMWANSDRFPHGAVAAYLAALVPESPRAMNERSNLNGIGLGIAGPQSLAGIPIVVITGDQDPRHPRGTDEAVAPYVGAEFIWLPDRGMRGHGHMMMIEDGNDAIADLILGWLDSVPGAKARGES